MSVKPNNLLVKADREVFDKKVISQNDLKLGSIFTVALFKSPLCQDALFAFRGYVFKIERWTMDDLGSHTASISVVSVPYAEGPKVLTIEEIIGNLGVWRAKIKEELGSAVPIGFEKRDLSEALSLVSQSLANLVLIDQDYPKRDHILFKSIPSEQ